MTELTPIPVSHYDYRVFWSHDDDGFVATCLEFPSLSWVASSQEQALAGLRNLITEVIADLIATSEPVPQPLAERRFSGKFNLRVGRKLHRQLAIAAAQQQLSLNQYINQQLSSLVPAEVDHAPASAHPNRAG